MDQQRVHLAGADRGTMPVVRSNLAQSSILRKLIGYGATHRSGLHTAMYGLPNFRVLTETRGPKRVADMILDGYQSHLSRLYPPGLFLFIDRRSLFAAGTSSTTNGSTGRSSGTA